MRSDLSISFTQKGDFKKLSGYLEKVKESFNLGILDKYGKAGVEALSAATPKDTGLTAGSWYYEIERQNGVITITWYNSNINKYVNIALILQYGHGTRNGGWVEGTDYINPALKPIFEAIKNDAWKEVTKS